VLKPDSEKQNLASEEGDEKLYQMERAEENPPRRENIITASVSGRHAAWVYTVRRLIPPLPFCL